MGGHETNEPAFSMLCFERLQQAGFPDDGKKGRAIFSHNAHLAWFRAFSGVARGARGGVTH